MTYPRSFPHLSHELTNSVYSRIKQKDIPTYLPLIPDGNTIPLIRYDRFITLLLRLGQNNWQPRGTFSPPAPRFPHPADVRFRTSNPPPAHLYYLRHCFQQPGNESRQLLFRLPHRHLLTARTKLRNAFSIFNRTTGGPTASHPHIIPSRSRRSVLCPP